ncbi:DUF669 domain-containing protein [Enterococcus larvae]|uniref:DUF669 domain-containing protein n=1 Tax=Enterococcus larvae TaxID=2794352 RepID=UPI003F2D2981
MTGFKVDYNEAQDFGAVPDGDYEVVIFNVVETATPGGAENINFDMIIRNDIQQPRQNSHLFHKLWKAKDTGKYNRGMVMSLAKAFGLQDGKEYSSFDDFLGDFAMRTAKVRVKNETSEYNGKTYDNTNIKKFEPSKFPELQHQFKSSNGVAPADNALTIDISDDDLPF